MDTQTDRSATFFSILTILLLAIVTIIALIFVYQRYQKQSAPSDAQTSRAIPDDSQVPTHAVQDTSFATPIAYIKKVIPGTPEATLTIDPAEMLGGQRAEDACRQDPECIKDDECIKANACLPNGYYIRNSDQKTKECRLSSSTIIRILTNGTEETPITVKEFVSILTSNNPDTNWIVAAPFVFDIAPDGTVRSITQQYIP